MKVNNNVKLVLKMINDHNFSAYIVGGAVRDYLLGKPINDYDVTTNAKPEDLIDIFSGYKLITTGIKHGTVGIVIKGEVIEVTTFRKESNYSDYRRPDEVVFVDDLYEDLSRRDFTINALAYDENVIDYFDGISDIKNKIIRTVGNPYIRFEEDPLRILRALRFSTKLDFEINYETSEAILNTYQLLDKISVERIMIELDKMLSEANFSKVLDKYHQVFKYLFNFKVDRLSYNFTSNHFTNYCLFFNDVKDEYLVEILNKYKIKKSLIRKICNVLFIYKSDITNELDILMLLKDYEYEEVEYGLKLKEVLDNYCFIDLNELKNKIVKLKDLKVNGTHFLKLDVPKEKIGNILNTLLIEVIKKELENKEEVLIERGLDLIER